MPQCFDVCSLSYSREERLDVKSNYCPRRYSKLIGKRKEKHISAFLYPNCTPCKNLFLLIDEIANKYNGKVHVCRMNVQESVKLAAEYEILSAPTLVCFKNGQPVDRIIGSFTKQEITKKIKELFSLLAIYSSKTRFVNVL